jgi:hypothetical protein
MKCLSLAGRGILESSAFLAATTASEYDDDVTSPGTTTDPVRIDRTERESDLRQASIQPSSSRVPRPTRSQRLAMRAGAIPSTRQHRG